MEAYTGTCKKLAYKSSEIFSFKPYTKKKIKIKMVVNQNLKNCNSPSRKCSASVLADLARHSSKLGSLLEQASINSRP